MPPTAHARIKNSKHINTHHTPLKYSLDLPVIVILIQDFIRYNDQRIKLMVSGKLVSSLREMSGK